MPLVHNSNEFKATALFMTYFKCKFNSMSGVNHIIENNHVATVDRTGQMSDRFVNSPWSVLVQMSGGRLSLVTPSSNLGQAIWKRNWQEIKESFRQTTILLYNGRYRYGYVDQYNGSCSITFRPWFWNKYFAGHMWPANMICAAT